MITSHKLHSIIAGGIFLLFILTKANLTQATSNTINVTNASSSHTIENRAATTRRTTKSTQRFTLRSTTQKASACACHCVTASSTSACFASDTLVTLINGNTIPIGHLRSNDKLMTSDGSNIIVTEMMMMLDQNRFSKTLFYTIVTASGNNISLTGLHLLPIVEYDDTHVYVPAKQVKIGDILRVLSDGQLVLSPVIRVTQEMKTGFYAPLTTAGTILVNDVVASCYANVQSHKAAHIFMGPLRWYSRLARLLSMDDPFGTHNVDGIHIVPRIMYEFARMVWPSMLRFV